MRLVDLHCDWLRQYAGETTLYAGRCYAGAAGRVGRLDGYLLGVSASVLVGSREPADWKEQAEPWVALGRMLARYESEFAGRILRDARDAERWQSDNAADGLCWGMLGVAGFEYLVRRPDDLGRLPALFERGVRLFQPVAGSDGELGGSTAPGDDRGLTELGRSFVERLVELSPTQPGAARPILDLAGMNATTLNDTLRWLDHATAARQGVPLTVSHGTGSYRDLLDRSTADHECVRELRARGVIIGITPGLPGCESIAELKALVEFVASIPFRGQPGFAGIAIGTDLLSLDAPSPELGTARQIARGVERSFDRDAAVALIAGNGRQMLLAATGVVPPAMFEAT